MYRSLLLALDDTPGAMAARDVAFATARRTGARLTVLSVFDRPHTTGLHEAVPLGGAAFAARRNQARAAAIAAEAERVLTDCAACAGAWRSMSSAARMRRRPPFWPRGPGMTS